MNPFIVTAARGTRSLTTSTNDWERALSTARSWAVELDTTAEITQQTGPDAWRRWEVYPEGNYWYDPVRPLEEPERWRGRDHNESLDFDSRRDEGMI